MKFSTNLTTFLLLFRFSTSWVSAAVIDPQAHSYAPSPVVKREVTYGDVFSDAAKSAVCNEGQRTILEQGMRDTVLLAKAGADGLAIILDMLNEEKTIFNALSETERHRYSETYYTFFGRVEDKAQWPLFRTRASYIKASLDRLSALTIETWPKSITIYCDSSFYQTADLLGKTSDQIPELQKVVLEPGFQFLFDSGSSVWINTSVKKTNCSDPSTRIDAYTTHRTKVNSAGVSERQDRMVFCPIYFRFIGVPTAQPKPPAASLIRPGLSLVAFQRKTERAPLRLTDVDGSSSYGPVNAQRLASNPETQALANRNVENVVYWCITMFYSAWDWSSTYAAEIGGGAQGVIAPPPTRMRMRM